MPPRSKEEKVIAADRLGGEEVTTDGAPVAAVTKGPDGFRKAGGYHILGNPASKAVGTVGSRDRRYYVPFYNSHERAIDRLGWRLHVAGTASKGQCAIYSNKGDTDPYPNVPLLTTADIDLATAGPRLAVATVSFTLLADRLYWLAFYIENSAGNPTFDSATDWNNEKFLPYDSLAGGSAWVPKKAGLQKNIAFAGGDVYGAWQNPAPADLVANAAGDAVPLVVARFV